MPHTSTHDRQTRMLDLITELAKQVEGGTYLTIDATDGRTIRLADTGQTMLNFTSCSYLGLEFDPRLIAAAHEALNTWGTQLSSSRIYLQTDLYREAEHYASKVTGHPTLVFPTTTLAHFGALPVFVQPGDGVVIDKLAHASVRTNLNIAANQGARLETVEHNNIEHYHSAIKNLRHDGVKGKIWIAVDGIYSMSGDGAPVGDIEQCLADHDDVWAYVDDAHGMSWTGDRGQGWWLSQANTPERTVVSGSLSKSFGAGGGILTVPDEKLYRILRTIGGSLVFSGPIQPPVLAASVTSLKLHAAGAMRNKQAELLQRILHMQNLLDERNIHTTGTDPTPIFFVQVGDPFRGAKILQTLRNRGYNTNLAMYPVVPVEQTGIRFTLSNHLNDDDLVAFADTLDDVLETV